MFTIFYIVTFRQLSELAVKTNLINQRIHFLIKNTNRIEIRKLAAIFTQRVYNFGTDVNKLTNAKKAEKTPE